MDSQNQLLPDVPREVQINVRHLRQGVFRQEPLQRQTILQRVDVAQADEVAHQHGDAGAAPPAWRRFFNGCLSVHQAQVNLHLTSQLDDLVVEEHEAGQVVLPDQTELLLQPLLNLGCDRPVATYRSLVAQLTQVGLLRVAFWDGIIREGVAKVSGQVEGALLSDAKGVSQGLRQLREEGRHLLCRFQIELAVRSSFPVGLFQALVVLDGDQAVLEAVPFPHVIVDVVGGDCPQT